MVTTVGAPSYTRRGLLVRNVLGDGSCGYRAVMFGMLEHNWQKTIDCMPIAVSKALPASRPRDLVAFFDAHDRALCAAARDLVTHRIEHDLEIREWAGDPRDGETEAGRALVDARNPHGYMDEVALHALAKALGVRIAIQFQHNVLVAPFMDLKDCRPVSVCLKPMNDAAPSNFVQHYMLCYPGCIHSGNRIRIEPSMHTTMLDTV